MPKKLIAPITPYTPHNWYWAVKEVGPGWIFSSAKAEYVLNTDTSFSAWLSINKFPRMIDTMANLSIVLTAHGLNAAASAATTPPVRDRVVG